MFQLLYQMEARSYHIEFQTPSRWSPRISTKVWNAE